MILKIKVRYMDHYLSHFLGFIQKNMLKSTNKSLLLVDLPKRMIYGNLNQVSLIVEISTKNLNTIMGKEL